MDNKRAGPKTPGHGKDDRFGRIEQVYHQALETPEDERSAFLAQACPGDDDLRLEVEKLLSFDRKAGKFMESPALDVAARALARKAEKSRSLNLAGQTILHYKVQEKIGEGGMGVVYRAEDTNLRRHVAIKILPDEFVDDAERLARFQREAQVLASLHHPNIATLYSLEESDGKRFIVMELVEGESLAQRLSKGPLPLKEALEICRQIAEGLEAAHEKGVIHRDLKPGNVMITGDDEVKVLDFGLAKALPTPGPLASPEDSPTITEAMTRRGVILGTAAYMSPEQAKGKRVDRRADVWALGCILFECLTGKAPFKEETVTETLVKILEAAPDWDLLPAATPRRANELLHRCLEKDPRERLHDIADVRIEIAEVLSRPSFPEGIAVRRPLRALVSAGVIGGLVVGAAAVFITWYFRPVPSLPVVRSELKIDSGQWLGGLRWVDRPTRTALAVANDGSFIVYSAILEDPKSQGKSQIYLRRLDQMDAAPVAGTERGINPFLSPDDRWIGFWNGGKLKKVPVGGGVPATLCDVVSPFGFDWGPDNTIVFSPQEHVGLSRISGEGGKPEVLTVPDKAKGEYGHRLPRFLPGGRAVLFTVMRHSWDLQPRMEVLDLVTGKWRAVIEDAADGRYLRTGHLVFLRQGMLMAVAFDLERLEIKGQPVPVIANVMQALNITLSPFNTAAGQYDISDSGWLAYVPGGILPDEENSLVRVDQKGNIRPVADFRAPFFAPRFSPDGRRIAYRTRGREWLLWIYDLDRGTASRLTGAGWTLAFAWTPDGRRLAFGWWESGLANLYLQPADGSSPMERLTTSENEQFAGSFTPDGATLAFVQDSPETDADILLLDIKSRRVRAFLDSKAGEYMPEISPDGRWLAYVTWEPGGDEVWVRSFLDEVGKWKISKEGGADPIRSKEGRELFYRRGDQAWVTDVRTEGGFSAGKPRLLFERQGFSRAGPIRSWDLWPDGQGFLMVKLDDRKPQPVAEMILVQNWFEELKRLVPTGKK